MTSPSVSFPSDPFNRGFWYHYHDLTVHEVPRGLRSKEEIMEDKGNSIV